jgi:hypothetical protein
MNIAGTPHDSVFPLVATNDSRLSGPSPDSRSDRPQVLALGVHCMPRGGEGKRDWALDFQRSKSSRTNPLQMFPCILVRSKPIPFEYLEILGIQNPTPLRV